jgi:cytochrome b6-f complex iron-sulfur subunit
MNARDRARYVDDLLAGRRPRPFQPDEFEAAQIRTAIDLVAARPGSDAPRGEFLSSLHRQLEDQMNNARPFTRTNGGGGTTRRQVIVGTSVAAAAAAVAVTADRLVVRGGPPIGGDSATSTPGVELMPNIGAWQAVASSADVVNTGMHPFDLGSITGFVRRVDGRPEAVSGVCTHQGCKLWFDESDDRLRCPCHATSFSPAGQVLS